MALIYLLNEQHTTNYKIGVTKSDTNKRKSSLQTGNSNAIINIMEFKTQYPYKVEKLLHRHFSKTRLYGEWFTLTDNQAMNFINTCQSYQNVVDYMLEHNQFYK